MNSKKKIREFVLLEKSTPRKYVKTITVMTVTFFMLQSGRIV